MNNKGFTLIELIVVIALVLVFAGIFSVNMTKGLQSQNKENEDKMISDFETAADAYIHTLPDPFEDSTTIKITQENLLNSGFIKPNDGYPQYVCAKKETSGLITFVTEGTC